MLYDGPPAAPGLRIGLLGGSFDPPHGGHVHITHTALRTLQLDRVWWLVTPGNPVKPHGPADLKRRMAACHEMIQHPRVVITDIESRLGSRFTADTLGALKNLYPHVRFVWLMGADNLVGFALWERWDWIMETVPVGVLARPNAQVNAGLSPAAQRYAQFRAPPQAAALLPFLDPPAWTLVTGPMSPLSSTAIREKGEWP
ncbi:MAG: nicotinate-nucleotide adenylyltransferase [Neomegalonema sp.]